MLTYLLVIAACGYGCRVLATKKGRNPNSWTVAGVVFGLLALVVIALMPSAKKNPGYLGSVQESPRTTRFSLGDSSSPNQPPPPNDSGFNPPKFG